MTLKLGNDYLAWIDSATPGTFAAIKGQGTFDESRSVANIDGSDKTTTGFALSAPGLATWSGNLSLRVNLPDTTGYTRMETVSNAQPQVPVIFQLRKNGLAAVVGDAVFAAPCYWSITKRTFGKDGTVDVTVELRLAGAPTVDTLA